jgi:flagellar hook-associated protein 3 FlgL
MARITQLSMTNTALAGLQANLNRVQKLQAQASSGLRIQVPSDDPQGTATAMQMRSQQAADAQYTSNAGFAASRLNAADTALQSLSRQVTDVRNLVLGSQNGSLSDGARTALSNQITQIKATVAGLYNTQYLGQPVFGGTSAAGVALDPSNAYVGDGNPVMVRISASATVRVDVDGTTIGADTLPGVLDQLALNVTGTAGAPQSDLDLLDSVLGGISAALGAVGAAEKRVTTTGDLVSAHSLDLTASIARTEQADLAEVLTKFSSQQVAYQAALGVAAKINQTSLLDFIQ